MRKRLTTGLLALAVCLVAIAMMAQSGDPAERQEPVKITQGPKVESTTGNSATIAWSTNAASSTLVRYGTDANNLIQTAQTPWGGLTHRVVIKGLQPNTTYYFKVDSSQAAGTGTSVTSDVQQFQTKNGNDHSDTSSAGPLVGPVVQDLTPTSATLWWHSDQRPSLSLKYGTSPASMDRSAPDQGGAGDHRVALTDLEARKTYYFALTRPDGSTACTGQFTTPQQQSDLDLRITNGPVLEFVGHNHAILAWSTSAPSSSIVKYGTDPNALTQSAHATWADTTHRVDITNLHPNTRYFFQVESNQTEGSGAPTQSAQGQFHTLGQGQAALALTAR